MAFRRTLMQRIFNISKVSNSALTNCYVSSTSPAIQSLVPPDPGDAAISRWLQPRRPFFQSAAVSPDIRSLPTGEKLLEKMRGMNFSGDRVRLGGLYPPPVRSELSVEDARKLLRLSQIETVKSNLEKIQRACISYAEFVDICVQGCSSSDQGMETARMLDQSGHVIVLGNTVFLRPDQVLKLIQGMLPVGIAAEAATAAAHPNDVSRRKELEVMELQKASIDKMAESMVRRELWGGLGFLVIQTAAFMRLTFWELSWDVMEPICFYLTSIYFMACYGFFLRTSKEPSFEGFFQSRFTAKQKRLIKAHNFDIDRYNELREACFPPRSTPLNLAFSRWFDETKGTNAAVQDY